ncbi:G patch domain-containing protein 11 [Stomoxys calcitrans]|uniref:G patch domain-containing protein 11 n=1 Tax=Stomoxys calcitrans TaxID=35570 RepID=A0A1I8PAF2_STOCA|nr:G patch domain-containing protein 11 [Stomoxys calcitrans]
MSDDDDYMSDKFLTAVADVRPSLINNRAKKRELTIVAKQKDNTKKQRETRNISSAVVNNEKLQEALSKPLESDNKGFKLLAKMGYTPGQALGKVVNNSNNTTDLSDQCRIVEPIGITIKSDRQGLGRETALKELLQRKSELRRQRLEKERGGETSIEEFRRRTTQKVEERFVAQSLSRCQKVCQNLDLDTDMPEPAMSWFWPQKPKGANDDAAEEPNTKQTDEEYDDEEEDDFSNVEKLEMLTNYIRTSYNFCFWCGIRYENLNDLNDNCPGPGKDDH